MRYKATLEEGIQQLLRQSTDAVMTWSLASLEDDLPSGDGGLAYMVAKDNTFDVNSVRMIWAGRPTPLALHIVHEDMPAVTREALQEAMIALTSENEAAFEAVRERFSMSWQAARAQDFTPLIDAIYGAPQKVSNSNQEAVQTSGEQQSKIRQSQ